MAEKVLEPAAAVSQTHVVWPGSLTAAVKVAVVPWRAAVLTGCWVNKIGPT